MWLIAPPVHHDHDPDDIAVLSLCSGGLGLDLGLELVVPRARVVCGVEWEARAVEHLGALMEAGCVAPFPVWSDLRTFDGAAWRGCVDWLTAGYPCQPFSTAGKRRGADDPRHLWPHVARVIAESRPRGVFLENVAGHVRLGLDDVVRELEGLGHTVPDPCVIAASDVGAPHKRDRVFILGVANSESRFDGRREQLAQGGEGSGRLADGVGGGLGSADAAMADAPGPGGDARPLFPPGPADFDRWRTVLAIDPTLEPSLCGVAHGLAADRRHWLRMLGNGVVPLQAAYALCTLWARYRHEH